MVCTSSEYLSTKKTKVILKLLDISDVQIQSVEKKKKNCPTGGHVEIPFLKFT